MRKEEKNKGMFIFYGLTLKEYLYNVTTKLNVQTYPIVPKHILKILTPISEMTILILSAHQYTLNTNKCIKDIRIKDSSLK